jgi:predicted dehydrogenase
MKKISIGVVGTNFVPDMFMKGISSVDSFNVIAVCATKEESIAKFVGKHPVNKTFWIIEEWPRLIRWMPSI